MTFDPEKYKNKYIKKEEPAKENNGGFDPEKYLKKKGSTDGGRISADTSLGMSREEASTYTSDSKGNISLKLNEENYPDLYAPIRFYQSQYIDPGSEEAELLQKKVMGEEGFRTVSKPKQAYDDFLKRIRAERAEEDYNYLSSVMENIDKQRAGIKSKMDGDVKVVLSKNLEKEKEREEVLKIIDKSRDDLLAIDATKKFIEDGKRYYETSDKNILNGLLKSQLAEDFWTLGLTEIYRDFDMLKIANKVKKGENISDAEQQALVAYGVNKRIKSNTEQDLGVMIGYGVSKSIPYMVSFAISGGQSTAAKEGTMKAIKGIAKNQLGKLTANAAGMVAGGAVRVPMLADFYVKGIEGQIGQVDVDDKFVAKLDPETQKTVAGSWGKAFVSTLGTAMIEETGQYITPQVNKLFKKLPFSSSTTRLSSPTFSRIANSTGFHGFWGEFSEEIIDQYYQSTLEGEFNPLSIYTPKELVATAGSVGIISGTMAGARFATRGDLRERISVVESYNQSRDMLPATTIGEVDYIMQGEDMDKNMTQLDSYLRRKKDEGVSEEETANILNYAVNSMRMDAFIEAEYETRNFQETENVEEKPTGADKKVEVEEKVEDREQVDPLPDVEPKEGTIEQEVKEETLDMPKVSDYIDSPARIGDEVGNIRQDGQTVVFETDKKIYELGNVEELSDRKSTLESFGITVEEPVDIDESGNITFRGRSYQNNFSDKTQAINYDNDGNVRSVSLETPDGNKRTFRGQAAEDIAYSIYSNEYFTQPEFNDYLNENNEQIDREVQEIAEKEAVADDARIPTEEKTREQIEEKDETKEQQQEIDTQAETKEELPEAETKPESKEVLADGSVEQAETVVEDKKTEEQKVEEEVTATGMEEANSISELENLVRTGKVKAEDKELNRKLEFARRHNWQNPEDVDQKELAKEKKREEARRRFEEERSKPKEAKLKFLNIGRIINPREKSSEFHPAKWFKRNFQRTKGIPKNAYEAYTKAMGSIRGRQYDITNSHREISKKIKEIYGQKLTEEQAEAINTALETMGTTEVELTGRNIINQLESALNIKLTNDDMLYVSKAIDYINQYKLNFDEITNSNIFSQFSEKMVNDLGLSSVQQEVVDNAIKEAAIVVYNKGKIKIDKIVSELKGGNLFGKPALTNKDINNIQDVFNKIDASNFNVKNIKSFLEEYKNKLTNKEYTDILGAVNEINNEEISNYIDEITKNIKSHTLNIPEAAWPEIRRMRDMIDSYSTELAKMDMIGQELQENIDKNRGYYMTRTYRKHTDRDWTWENIPDKIKEDAAEVIYELYPEYTQDETFGLLRSLLEDKDVTSSLISRGNSLADIDNSSLRGRSKFLTDNPEIRRFLGENKDPFYNYAVSLSRMAEMIERGKMVENMIEIGKQEGFLTERPSDKKDLTVKISTDKGGYRGKPEHEKLSDYYTTPEIAKAFNNFFNNSTINNGFIKLYMRFVNTTKLAKTAGSVRSDIRNFESNIQNVVVNANYNLDQVVAELRSLNLNKKENKQAFVRDLYERAIIGDNVVVGEFVRNLQDISNRITEISSIDETIGEKYHRKVRDAALKFYSIGDDVWKAYRYVSEYTRYRKAYSKKMTRIDAEEKAKSDASKILHLTSAYYSELPLFIQNMRKLPFTNTFISFPYITMTNYIGTLQLALSEIKTPELRHIGIQRGLSAGVGIASLSNLALLMNRSNGNDDDDMKGWRRFLPKYFKNDIIIVNPKGEGKASYNNISYMDYYNSISTPIFMLNRSLMTNGKITNDDVAEATKEFFSNFLSWDIVFSKSTSVMRNEDYATGRKIYYDTDKPQEVSLKVAAYLYEAIEPGTITDIKRIRQDYREGKDWQARLKGMLSGNQTRPLDPEESMEKYKLWQYKEGFHNAGRIYKDELNDYEKLKEPTKEETKILQKSKKRAEEELNNIVREIQEDISAMIRLGIPETQDKVYKMMKEHKFDTDIVKAVFWGKKIVLDEKGSIQSE